MIGEEVEIIRFCNGDGPFFCSKEDNLFSAKIFSDIEYYNPVILYGPSGVGKSHITRGFMMDFAEGHNKSVKIIPAADLINQMVRAVRKSKVDVDVIKTILQYYEDIDILIIDDAFVVDKRKDTQSLLLDFIMQAKKHNITVVLIIDELEKLSCEFRSKFSEVFDKGIYVDMRYPSLAVKMAFANYYAKQVSVENAESIKRIAEKEKTIGQIKGALLSCGFKSDMTIPMP